MGIIIKNIDYYALNEITEEARSLRA